MSIAASACFAPVAAMAASERLSDEFTYTRSASATEETAILSEPRAGAAAVGKLRYATEHGNPEVYLLLARQFDARGGEWIQLRIPARPNGRTGWVRRDSLGDFLLTNRHLRIDRGAARATLFVGGRKTWSFPVGVGAPGTPTPGGRAWIREKFAVRGGGGAYGPYAFGTSIYSHFSGWARGGVIGLHGTNQPALIPGRPSHGCVRVRNPDVVRLYASLPVGASLSVV